MVFIFRTQYLCPASLNFTYIVIPCSQGRGPRPHSLAWVFAGDMGATNQNGEGARSRWPQAWELTIWKSWWQCFKVYLLFTPEIFEATGQWPWFSPQDAAVSLHTPRAASLALPGNCKPPFKVFFKIILRNSDARMCYVSETKVLYGIPTYSLSWTSHRSSRGACPSQK